MSHKDSLEVKDTLTLKDGSAAYFSLEKLEKQGYSGVSRMPRTVKIFIESVLRQLDGETVTEDHLKTLLHVPGHRGADKILRDFLCLDEDGAAGLVNRR